jgi:hypothetical protein
VDLVAPDSFCAGLLVGLVGSWCPYELVGTGAGWVVRLQQRTGVAWEADLLLLVQRWLEACPLPCATIISGGRRYLLRLALTPGPVAGFDALHANHSVQRGRSPLREAVNFAGLSRWGSLTP